MNIKQIWSAFITEAKQPSRDDESVYMFALIAVGHIWLGSLLGLLGLFVPFIVWILPIAYFLFKEVPDVARGGSWSDAFVDLFFVCVGIAYNMILFPVNLIVATGLVIIMAYAKFSRKAVTS